ncbi:MAG: reverse transcriptase family protein [Zoogloeaceae bacterium]|jgi:retron-type reverse transcriptase|nr:reverse transcriptase family protein [Zoogloeaceae bacterium]
MMNVIPPSSPANPVVCEVARALADAFLAGENTPGAMRERGIRALGRSWPWLAPLTLRLRFDLGKDAWQPGQRDAMLALILAFPAFQAAFETGDEAPRIKTYFYPVFHARMEEPPRALAGLALSPLATSGDLADWLGLSPGMLDWFANMTRRDDGVEKRAHYHARWVAKKKGGARLIEAPKERLRAIQRRILREILDAVPVHPAAHGCVPGRSVLDNAALHVGSPLLLKLDLRDFFTSIRASRVHALFRTLGYPRMVARHLTGMTTHRTPLRVLREVPQEEYPSPEERLGRQIWTRQFMERHLPQGAPTSPSLANLCAWRLDTRLDGAARECQARYSRYVDDIVLSCADGNPARGRRILEMVQNIILEEGFSPNWRKTRMLSSGGSQRITGLVVNRRPNLPRREYDLLKAILTNCRRHGTASQNRHGLPDFRAHLLEAVSRNSERSR